MKRTTVMKRKKSEGIKVYAIFIPILVLMMGLFIVNQPSIITFFTAERNYEETANIMSNFIVAEYERQRSELAEGEEVELEEIIKLAKRLDSMHGLSVSFSDDQHAQSFSIYKELDGGEFIKFNKVVLD